MNTTLNLTVQLGGDGGQIRIFDFSNSRRTRRLTNGEVIGRVARFLRTGDRHHLPPALRPEADGIRALALHVLLTEEIPAWPVGAARPDPGPGASIGDLVRAMVGDEAADAPSEIEDDADGAA